MDLEYLWQAAEEERPLALSTLDSTLQECLLQGDLVFDHYGEKPPFVVLEYKGSRILLLERVSEDTAFARSIVNATGGYGTGILGDKVSDLSPLLAESLASVPCANDEFASPDRWKLTSAIKTLIAKHTHMQPQDWEITFCSTGTEAIDFACQILQLEGYDLGSGVSSRSTKDVVVACRGAWHGWGIHPNQLIDRRQFTEGLPRFSHCEIVFHNYGDVKDLEEIFHAYAGRIRAVFVEGILGDGGIIEGSPSWWKRLEELAKQEEARVVVDEILTCFRTGTFLAFPEGMQPDCITLGKGLGLGIFPLSAVAWKKGALNPRPGIGVRTFNARPLHCRVVLKALEMVEKDQLFERSKRVGKVLLDRLKDLPTLYPSVYKAVRGRGLMIGIELSEFYGRKGRKIRDELVRAGLLAELESGLSGFKIPRHLRIQQTIRLTPPLTLPEEEIGSIVQAFSLVGQRMSV